MNIHSYGDGYTLKYDGQLGKFTLRPDLTFPEAPIDGRCFVRSDEDWVDLETVAVVANLQKQVQQLAAAIEQLTKKIG